MVYVTREWRVRVEALAIKRFLFVPLLNHFLFSKIYYEEAGEMMAGCVVMR